LKGRNLPLADPRRRYLAPQSRECGSRPSSTPKTEKAASFKHDTALCKFETEV